MSSGMSTVSTSRLQQIITQYNLVDAIYCRDDLAATKILPLLPRSQVLAQNYPITVMCKGTASVLFAYNFASQPGHSLYGWLSGSRFPGRRRQTGEAPRVIIGQQSVFRGHSQGLGVCHLARHVKNPRTELASSVSHRSQLPKCSFLSICKWLSF